jgi:hypothetical protein
MFHRFEDTSLGGIAMAQYWVELIVWEGILNSTPGLTGIVELGTWKGGFSLYLDMQARARGLSFRSYDILKPDHEIPGFIQKDIYRYADDLKREFSALGPIVLFCDGGNKPRELRTFPPCLAEGSLVAVHDWGTETLPGDVPDFLEPIHEEYLDNMGSVTRWFTLKGES